MKVSFDMNDEAYAAMERFAEEKDISVSEFIRRALLERLEGQLLMSEDTSLSIPYTSLRVAKFKR